MAHALDEYKDLLGKVSLEKIAETAGVSLDEVTAWAGGQAPNAPKASPAKAPKAAPAAKPRAPRIEAIRVLETTAISIETPRGRRVRVSVPKSIYRGDIARKYASILSADTFEVLHSED